MKKFLLKILILVILLFSSQINGTNAVFSDKVSIEGINVSTGCWVAPTVPVLVYPTNPTYAGAGSAWDLNPYMDWENSVSTCPLDTTITYQYQSAHDSGFTDIAYTSGWLSNSQIPAPGTPEGTYYWHVRAQDNFGNTSDWSTAWKLVVDRTPPDTIIDTTEFTFHSTEANSTFMCKMDSGSFEACTSPKTYTGLSDGSHTFYVEAIDEAGNVDPTPAQYTWTISGTPPAPSGDVVINEVMWMGSTYFGGGGWHDEVNDEWIELRNMKDYSIDLSGWQIVNAGSGDSPIILSGSIAPNSFYLITNYLTDHSHAAINDSITADENHSNLSFLNGGEQLILKNSGGTTIDQTPPGAWAAGEDGTNKKSMERNDTPSDGTQISNWHTCTDSGCNDTTYWDTEGNNYGTPKGANLSENDPSVTPPVKPEPELELAKDDKNITFVVKNIGDYSSLSYELTYDTDSVAQGATGDVDLAPDQGEFSKTILLGTCSSGGTCVYHSGVKNVHLKVVLHPSAGEETILEKSI